MASCLTSWIADWITPPQRPGFQNQGGHRDAHRQQRRPTTPTWWLCCACSLGRRGGKSLLAMRRIVGRVRRSPPQLEAVARKAWPRDVVTPGLAHEPAAIEANAIPVLPRMMHGWCSATCGFGQNAPWQTGAAMCPPTDPASFDFIDADMAKMPCGSTSKGRHALGQQPQWCMVGRPLKTCLAAARRCLVRAWVDGFSIPARNPCPLRA